MENEYTKRRYNQSPSRNTNTSPHLHLLHLSLQTHFAELARPYRMLSSRSRNNKRNHRYLNVKVKDLELTNISKNLNFEIIQALVIAHRHTNGVSFDSNLFHNSENFCVVKKEREGKHRIFRSMVLARPPPKVNDY